MKHLKFLLLALVAMVSTGAWAQTYTKLDGGGTEGTWPLADLEAAVANDGSATIALGIVSNTSSSYGTTDGPNYFLSIDNNKVKTLENKNVFTIEPGTEGKYTLKTQDGLYVQTGTAGYNATLGDAANAAQFSLSAVTPSDYDPKYETADMVRFDIGGTFLNCQDKTGNTRYRNGTGGYSAFVIWKIQKEAATPKTYTFHITGAKGMIFYDGSGYTDGETVNTILDESKLSARDVDGYDVSITVEGTDITATYTVHSLYPFAVTSSTQFDNTFACTFTTARGAWTANTDATKVVSTDGAQGPSADAEYQKFAVLYLDGDFRLYNVKAKKFVNYVDESTAALVADKACGWTFEEDSNKLVARVAGQNIWFNLGGSFQVCLNSWSTHDPGNMVTVSAVEEFTAEQLQEAKNIWGVGYNYTVNITGDPTGTATVQVAGIDGVFSNGDAVESQTAVTAADVTAQNIEGYIASVSVESHNINVAYAKDRTIDPATFAGKFVTAIGAEKTDALTASDTQWYLLKQNRGGETSVYDNGTAVMRASVGADVSVNDDAANVKQYLVRFVQSEDYPAKEGVYNIQFGTSRFFENATGNNHKVLSSTTPGNYRVYLATEQTGYGHWAINVTTDGDNFADKVDNDGSGNTVGLWGTGETTSGTNNIWAIYPVTLGEISGLEYTVNITGDPMDMVTVQVAGIDGIYSNGDIVQAESPIQASDVVAPSIDGYGQDVAIVGTNINVTYYVNSLEGLNNNSVYNLFVPRGQLHYNGEKLTAANEAFDADNGKFAFIKSDAGNYYVYNRGANMFVGEAAALGTPSKSTVINNNTDGDKKASYPFYMTMGTNYYNVDGAGNFYVDSWTTLDDGNQWRFVYAGDADLNEAIEAVNEFEADGGLSAYKAEVKTTYASYVWGDGLGEYTYNSEAIDFNTAVDACATRDELDALVASVAINMPAANTFLRVKANPEKIASAYLTSTNVVPDGKEVARAQFSDTAEDGTILLYDGTNLVNYTTGLKLISNAEGAGFAAWADGVAEGTAVEFSAASQGNGLYNVTYNGTRHLYSNAGMYTDAGNSLNNDLGYTFVLEEVTELPLTLTAVNGVNYSTLYLPVAATISADAEVYVAEDGATAGHLKMTQAGQYVAANTGVVLVSNATAATATLNATGTMEKTGLLSGATELENATDDAIRVFSKKNGEDVVGFYALPTGVTTLKGFKAYYVTSDKSISAFELDWSGTTGILGSLLKKNVEGAYDLQGRKVNNVQKGSVYILNGKKVIK